MTLASLPWPAVDAASSILAVPVGSTEQHGPHLPLSTDTDIAVAVANGLARARTDVLVAPPLPYGSSGEHAGFPGTLSIGQTAVGEVLVELVRSADAFRGVILVSAHGGNFIPTADAARRLEAEGRSVLLWSPVVEGDLHAGRTETSLMLAIAPGTVRLGEAAAGNTRPLVELIGTLRAQGVAAVSATGVLGDPAGASATEGRELLERITAQLVAAVDRRWPRP